MREDFHENSFKTSQLSFSLIFNGFCFVKIQNFLPLKIQGQESQNEKNTKFSSVPTVLIKL